MSSEKENQGDQDNRNGGAAEPAPPATRIAQTLMEEIEAQSAASRDPAKDEPPR